MRRMITVLALIATVTGCHGHEAATEAGVEAGPPPPELPTPFAAVRIGTTEAELKVMFPALEDI